MWREAAAALLACRGSRDGLSQRLCASSSHRQTCSLLDQACRHEAHHPDQVKRRMLCSDMICSRRLPSSCCSPLTSMFCVCACLCAWHLCVHGLSDHSCRPSDGCATAEASDDGSPDGTATGDGCTGRDATPATGRCAAWFDAWDGATRRCTSDGWAAISTRRSPSHGRSAHGRPTRHGRHAATWPASGNGRATGDGCAAGDGRATLPDARPARGRPAAAPPDGRCAGASPGWQWCPDAPSARDAAAHGGPAATARDAAARCRPAGRPSHVRPATRAGATCDGTPCNGAAATAGRCRASSTDDGPASWEHAAPATGRADDASWCPHGPASRHAAPRCLAAGRADDAPCCPDGAAGWCRATGRAHHPNAWWRCGRLAVREPGRWRRRAGPTAGGEVPRLVNRQPTRHAVRRADA